LPLGKLGFIHPSIQFPCPQLILLWYSASNMPEQNEVPKVPKVRITYGEAAPLAELRQVELPKIQVVQVVNEPTRSRPASPIPTANNPPIASRSGSPGLSPQSALSKPTTPDGATDSGDSEDPLDGVTLANTGYTANTTNTGRPRTGSQSLTIEYKPARSRSGSASSLSAPQRSFDRPSTADGTDGQSTSRGRHSRRESEEIHR
jgi:hypothetical protein